MDDAGGKVVNDNLDYNLEEMRSRQLWRRMGVHSSLRWWTWYNVLYMISSLRGQVHEDPKTARLKSDQELGDFVISNLRDVYVGGTNVIYHLDWNLNVLESVRTGPQMDSARCHANGDCPDDVSKELTDNVNKALVVDEENKKLIVCGSIRQGACSMYSLNNISSQVEFWPQSVAANDADSSTFAFIGKLLM